MKLFQQKGKAEPKTSGPETKTVRTKIYNFVWKNEQNLLMHKEKIDKIIQVQTQK